VTEIVIGYEPRELQLEIHEAIDSHRFTVVVAHRRFGKTVSAINHLIKAAIECDKPNPRFAYIAPTYSQAKRVAWDYLLEYTRPLSSDLLFPTVVGGVLSLALLKVLTISLN